MKYIILIACLVVFLSAMASANLISVNTTYWNNLSNDANGTSGIIFIPHVNLNLIHITQSNLSTAPNCIVISPGGLALAQGTFSGNNCTLNANLTAGTIYRIGTNYTTIGTWRTTYNTTHTVNPGFPVTYPAFGNITGGYFGSQNNLPAIFNVSTIYSVTDLFFGAVAGSVNVNLISPATDFTSFQSSQVFNSTGSSTGGYNITNATTYVWFSNGSLVNSTNMTRLGTSNSSVINITNLANGNYLWNALWCASNSTQHLCSFGSNNFSFQIRPFQVNNVTFNGTVLETSSQSFNINITTVSSILSVSATLVYDRVSYLGNTSCVGAQCIVSRTIDIPIANSTPEQNKTFNWVIRVFDGTSQISYNNSFRNQTVRRIYMEACGINTNATALNFTVYDEQNRTRIPSYNFLGTFNFWLGTGNTYRNQSYNSLAVSERTVCIGPSNMTFNTDAQISYDGADANNTYNERNYYFQNASVTNTTQNIRLFLLKRIDSTSFIQRVISTSQIPISSALIYSQRYYPGNDSYETVSISRSDNQGESVGFYEVEIPDYRHFISKNGELLKITERGKVIPQSSPFTLTFTIGENVTLPWQQFEGLTSLVSNLSYNNNTRLVMYTWIDTTGALSIANLTVEINRLNQSNGIFCSTTSILQAGTLTCNLSGQNGTFTAKGYIGRSPQVLDQLITIILNRVSDIVAKPFLFLWMLLLISAIGASLFYPPVGIPLVILVTIVGMVMGITAVGWVFVWAIAAVGVWILIESSR